MSAFPRLASGALALTLAACGAEPALAQRLDDTSAHGAAAVTDAPAAAPSTDDDERESAPLPPAAPDAPRLRKALVIGTWSADGPEGFDESWVDEAGLRYAYNKDRSRRREWRGVSTGSDVIQVDALIPARGGPEVGYVLALISRVVDDVIEPEYPDTPAVLHVKHRGRVQVRLDGEVVGDAPPSPDGPSTARFPIVLDGPSNTVLVKVGKGELLGPSLDVGLTVSALDGSALAGVSWLVVPHPALREPRGGAVPEPEPAAAEPAAADGEPAATGDADGR